MIQKHRVLMINDNFLILTAFSYLLQNGDFEILTAKNKEKAIKILREKPIAVIVSDEILATEEGLPILETLLMTNPLTQRIIFTGWPEESLNWEKIKGCKPFAVVDKPDIDHQLRKAIRAAIKEYEKQSAQQPARITMTNEIKTNN